MRFGNTPYLGLLVLLMPLVICGRFDAAAQGSVTLAWDQSDPRTVAGYRLYYGVESRSYTNLIDVGSSASATLSNLTAGVAYFFAVTAYDVAGLESEYSTEISYTMPIPVSLQILVDPSGGVLLKGTGPPGHTYDILSLTGVPKWTVIGTVTMDASGSFEFLDPTAPSIAIDSRVYRLLEVFLPAAPPLLSLQAPETGPVTLSGIGPAGHRYDLLASEDCASWNVISSVVMDLAGRFEFSVADAPAPSARFYRLHETTYNRANRLPTGVAHISASTGAK